MNNLEPASSTLSYCEIEKDASSYARHGRVGCGVGQLIHPRNRMARGYQRLASTPNSFSLRPPVPSVCGDEEELSTWVVSGSRRLPPLTIAPSSHHHHGHIQQHQSNRNMQRQQQQQKHRVEGKNVVEDEMVLVDTGIDHASQDIKTAKNDENRKVRRRILTRVSIVECFESHCIPS